MYQTDSLGPPYIEGIDVAKDALTVAGNKVANWIGGVSLVIGIPSALVAWSELRDNGDDPTSSTTRELAVPSDLGGDSGGSGEEATPPNTGGSPDAQFDINNCQIKVDHIGAEIKEEPDHASRTLSSVPAETYTPLAAAEADWAGRTELWFQLDVEGRIGWLADSTIIVVDKSAGCP